MDRDGVPAVANIRLTPGDAEGEQRLCRLLRPMHSLGVRTAAAAALGKAGSEAALPAVLEALQGCYVRGSHGWNRAAGFTVAGACVLVAVGSALFAEPLATFLQQTGLSAGALLLALGALATVWSFFRRQAEHRRLLRTLGDAVVEITERSGSLQGRAAVPLLQTTADDFLQYDGETRRHARALAEKVDTLTRDRGKLPVPSTSPLTGDVLPRPSQPGAPPAETLPRVPGEPPSTPLTHRTTGD